MKTHIKYLLLFVLAIATISCSNDDDIYDSDIVGSWNWESTGGGEAFQIFETPRTRNNSVEIQIHSNQSFVVIENEVQIADGTYELEKRRSTLTEEKERFIIVTINTADSPEAIIYEGIISTYDNGSRLTIQEDFEGGVTSVFKKM